MSTFFAPLWLALVPFVGFLLGEFITVVDLCQEKPGDDEDRVGWHGRRWRNEKRNKKKYQPGDTHFAMYSTSQILFLDAATPYDI